MRMVYAEFTNHLKRGSFNGAFRIAIEHPSVVFRFILGLSSMVKYRIPELMNHAKVK